MWDCFRLCSKFREDLFYRQEGEYIIIIAEGKEHRMATVKESSSTVRSGS